MSGEVHLCEDDVSCHFHLPRLENGGITQPSIHPNISWAIPIPLYHVSSYHTTNETRLYTLYFMTFILSSLLLLGFYLKILNVTM